MQEEGESFTQEWPVKLFRLRQDGRWEQAYTKHPLRVSPRTNAIAFPSIRYRIKLGTSTNQQRKEEEENTVTIMRRENRVSVTTLQPEQPPRCAVLQFDSEADCVAFCDALLHLNRIHVGSTSSDDSRGGSTLLEEPDHAIADIRRILMSNDFLEFVDSLEQSLTACPEGAALLDALDDSVDDDFEDDQGF